MKTYKVVALSTNDEVVDLVNVEDETDIIPAAPFTFKDGDLITEEQFYLKECNYVDDNTTGTMNFAFPVGYIEE